MSAAVDDEFTHLPKGLSDDLDMLLVFGLMRTHSYLAPFIDTDLREHHLTSAQLNALLVLRGAGREGIRMGELGRRLVVTKSNVTGLVDRLERLGLATRAACPDRRAIQVMMTPTGRKALDRTTPRLAKLLAELTDCLDDQQKQTLIRLLSTLRRDLRRRRKEER